MNQPYSPSVAVPAASPLATNKVLRNTYLLLSMTLVFSAVMAGISMALGVPRGAGMICSLVALGLLWFVVPRTANSANGLISVFAVTGLLGFGLGPVLNAYLHGFANGGQIVMLAMGGTGVTFVGLSAYALRTQKDFSFMRQALFAGVMIAFVAAMVAFVVLAVGNALGPATTILALLLCAVALAIGLAVLLPRQWAGWAAASAYAVSGALLVLI